MLVELENGDRIDLTTVFGIKVLDEIPQGETSPRQIKPRIVIHWGCPKYPEVSLVHYETFDEAKNMAWNFERRVNEACRKKLDHEREMMAASRVAGGFSS